MTFWIGVVMLSDEPNQQPEGNRSIVQIETLFGIYNPWPYLIWNEICTGKKPTKFPDLPIANKLVQTEGSGSEGLERSKLIWIEFCI